MANGVPFERHTREWWGRLTDEQRAAKPGGVV